MARIPDPDRATADFTEPEPTTAQSGRDHLIRSEERLNVSTTRVPSSRVRLEKFVVTETRTITVEVSHEEVRLVHLDLAETGGTTTDSAAADADDRWLVLSEEQVVITKTIVPLERVRLQRNTIMTNREVTEQVRRERIEVDPGTARDNNSLTDSVSTTPEEIQ